MKKFINNIRILLADSSLTNSQIFLLVCCTLYLYFFGFVASVPVVALGAGMFGYFTYTCVQTYKEEMLKIYKSIYAKIIVAILTALALAYAGGKAQQTIQHITHQNPIYFKSTLSFLTIIYLIPTWAFFIALSASVASFCMGPYLIKKAASNDNSARKIAWVGLGLIGIALSSILIVKAINPKSNLLTYYTEKFLLTNDFYTSPPCKNIKLGNSDRFTYLGGTSVLIAKKSDGANHQYRYFIASCMK